MSTGAADQQTFNNELRGALFKNDKQGNPARPDYRGNCEINGQRYRISAWLRQAKSTGATFMSLAFTADMDAAAAAAAAAAPNTPPPEPDDIPF